MRSSGLPSTAGNAQLQADAIQDALLERGVDANIYLGYNFMPPFIEDAVDLARRDGVTDLIVFNKGRTVLARNPGREH